MDLPINYDDSHWTERKKARAAYVNLQKGMCRYCGERLSHGPSYKVLSKKINKNLFPGGFFDHPVHLHHNHSTGMTLGATHSTCNAVLWQYHGK